MKYDLEKLKNAVKASTSLAGVLEQLSIVVAGGNYKTIKRKIKDAGLDTSHFTGQGHLRGKTHNWKYKIPLCEILVEHSKFTSSNHLRERLLDEKVFEPKCSCCQRTEWLEQPIPLELDHINGVDRDNRLNNLRLLCPNCHALTPNYRGKNIKKNKC